MAAVDKFMLERALLIGVVRDKKWNILILNGIDESYFSPSNKELYKYIKKYVDDNKYPDLQIISYEFDIDDVSMVEYTQIHDLQGLCDTLIKEYLKSHLYYEVNKMNEHSDLINTQPIEYIQIMGDTYDKLKRMGFANRTVGLFDNIEEIMKLDPNNVIKTGFTELDDVLTGWQRGEELVVLVGRTGQGKSWLGLKFAMHAALNGERVGIYSGEMSTQQLQERSLCCAKQNYTDSAEDALKFIQEKNLDIRILTQSELRRRATVEDIEAMIIRDDLNMVVVDQLSLMDDIQFKVRSTNKTNI